MPHVSTCVLKWAWIGASACCLALGIFSTHLEGQGRSYSFGPEWWEPGRGILFTREADFDNPQGEVRILSLNGNVRVQGHGFFEALGSNGRACITCHQPANAMSVSRANLQQRWIETSGKDPIFAAVDGSNCPSLAQADRASHSLTLDRGLFRLSLPWPPRDDAGKVIQPEFQLEVVNDPTGCNSGPGFGPAGASHAISVYRRPRVVANFKGAIDTQSGFILMADGREPTLRSQAITAALVHEQAAKQPSEAQLRDIVDFEMQLFAAQGSHVRGGLLHENGGPMLLGPENVATRAGLLNGGAAAARSFAMWSNLSGAGMVDSFRASVARGSNLFFDRTFPVALAIDGKDDVRSTRMTCGGCHQGSATSWMDIGTTTMDTSTRESFSRNSELPTFRITCDSGATPHPLLGRTLYTHDPGRALTTGKCADVGSIVMQQLRGLSARAPYFSNGSAATLRQVVDFYDSRFAIGYTEQEKQDLVNFLSVL